MTSPIESLLPGSLQRGAAAEGPALKACCAISYEHEWVRVLLGESLHPGGLRLTGRLGEWMALTPEDTLLDVACGAGASAVHLARRFGCRVIGVDLGVANVERARAAAAAAGVADRVEFRLGDAERLPLPNGAVDAVLCECAFCVFPDKSSAAAEFARVLRPGGRLGLSDLTREGALPPELDSLLAWVACVADALPLDGYTEALETAGLTVRKSERHDGALLQLVEAMRLKLVAARVAAGLGKLTLPAGVLDEARRLATLARDEVRRGHLGYAALLAERSP